MKAREFEENDMRANWIQVAGYQRRERGEFERTRLLAYITAKFGNSHPKKFPKTVQEFLPLPWDEEKEQAKPMDIRAQYEENQRLLAEAIAKQQAKGGTVKQGSFSQLMKGRITENER